MRSFDHPNYDGKGFICPICRTDRDEKVTLVPIPGTEDGGVCEAEQVHISCIKNALDIIERCR